jgi:hypothetical protein
MILNVILVTSTSTSADVMAQSWNGGTRRDGYCEAIT